MAAVVSVARNGTGYANNWLMGEGIFKNAPPTAHRSFVNPSLDSRAEYGSDWFPDRGFYTDPRHINSTILSHAYYLMIFGGRHANYGVFEHIPNILVTPLHDHDGTSEAMAREIIMQAFIDPDLAFTPTFKSMKSTAMAKAFSTYGSAAQTTVKKAFEAVGVCGANTAPPTSAPTLTSMGDLLCAGRFNPTWQLMPGVNRFYAEVAPSQIGFALATPVSDVDGETDSCFFRVNQASVFHIRACNSCGCGPWSETEYLPYWSPCP